VGFHLTLEEFAMWLYEIAQAYGYSGSFLLSFVSNLILFAPIPYLLIIFWLSATPSIDPITMGIISAIGAALGKVAVYYIGRGSRKLLDEKEHKDLEFARLIMEKYGVTAIFLFAATPSPDDALYIPLGMMNYNILKFFISCLLGKILMTLVVSFGGHYSVGWMSSLLGGGGVWSIAVTIIFIIASVYMTVKIDWEKLFYKYFSKVPKKSKK
jgi:membrane protein DedA with SNARE-associated domain